MKQIMLLIFIAITFTACIDLKEVVGSYQVDFPFGHESLVLKMDGTFEKKFIFNKKAETYPEGKVIKNNGTWVLGKELSFLPFYEVKLDNFIRCWNWNNLNIPESDIKAVNVAFEVIQFFGNVKIIINDDLGIFYKKN